MIPAHDTATTDQIRALQAARRSFGMDDDDYRAWLAREAGVGSTRDLTRAQAAALLDQLNRRGRRAPAATASGRYTAKLRALWISAWHLGVVRERDDRALIAFVERQTGLTHTRFLTDAKEASKAIEALKSWIARQAGVVWPKDGGDALSAKRAVLRAQARMLAGEHGVNALTLHVPDDQLDVSIAEFGRQIRRAGRSRRAS
jgi:alkanesulfonate monooxygenase SsuD/methylene tetrahydromethanopterin reductase-like flavin-dependent oxidoreductase (luciferase family)